MEDTAIPSRLREKLENLAMLRKERYTYEQCSKELHISVRQLKRYAAMSEFKQIWKDLEREWFEQASLKVKDAGHLAISTLIYLMQSERTSAHVRFECAKAIGDWAGLGQENAVETKDDRQELLAIAELQRERIEQHLHIHLPEGHPEYIEAEIKELTD